MRTGKRLFAYAMLYRKTLILAILMLIIAVAAELTGPFIAKKMIDEHILGIETPWYEVDGGEHAVAYNGTYYARGAYLEPGDKQGKEARILQIGNNYYFIDGPVMFDGDRSVSNGRLTITNGNQSRSYHAVHLTKDRIFAFYRPEIGGLITLSITFFGLLIVSIFFHYGQHYLLQSSANRIIQKMREDVFSHIQTLPVKYFDTLPAGKVVARITNDTETIRDLYVTVLSQFITSFIYMGGIYVAMFLLDPRLAALCLVMVPVLIIWLLLYRKFASVFNHKIRSINSEINAKINESIQGMAIIQVFRNQKETKREFEELNDTHFRYQNKMLNLNSLLSHNLVNFLRNLVFVGLIWYFGGAALNAKGMISLGVLYAFIDYLNRLFQPVTGIVNQFAQLELARVSAERVFRLLDEKGTKVDEKQTERYEGNVVFDNVSFAYNDENYVLKDISFEAKKGETVALVGHTGSGKSSIMNVLFRFYDIQKGDVTIDGRSIYSMSRQEVRRYMGIVLQDPYLFTGTIASNVSLTNENIPMETVEKALKQVGAEELFSHLPKGFDEPVFEKGSTFSTGQRQLISFARALAYDPSILILDEATANIDTETEAVIQRALDVVKKGRTTFVIAHRLSTIRNADLILVLDKGRIIEKGNHEELMKQKGQYYQMYELQKGKKETMAG